MFSFHIQVRPDGGPCSLSQASRQYLLHLKACGRSALTLDSYRRSLALLEVSLGQSARLGSIRAGDLDSVLTGLAGTPGTAQRSETTLNRMRSTYRAFFRWAFQEGWITHNPARGIRLARVDQVPAPAMAQAETSRLLTAIRNSADPLALRDEVLFTTYALTGLRRAEALRLVFSDYDPGEMTLRVKEGKGRQSRSVPVEPQLAVLLGSLRTRGQDGARFFPGRVPGRPLSVRQANERFRHWSAAAGLRPELTIHSLRSGFATALHRSGGGLPLISRALGHRDVRPTLRYVEPLAGELRALIGMSFAGVFPASAR